LGILVGLGAIAMPARGIAYATGIHAARLVRGNHATPIKFRIPKGLETNNEVSDWRTETSLTRAATAGEEPCLWFGYDSNLNFPPLVPRTVVYRRGATTANAFNDLPAEWVGHVVRQPGSPTAELCAGGLDLYATRGVASGAAHGIGFRSFEAFKRVVGAAGSNQQWHHIVEQTAGNVGRFGSTAVHNTGNLVRLETGVHRQISGFYSSIQPQVTGSSSLTVRQWLGGQTFEAQQDFGRQLLQQFGGL